MSVYIDAAVFNDKGRIRKNNEDNLLFDGFSLRKDALDAGCSRQLNNYARIQYYAICDGMGGADAGEEASYCAVTELHNLTQHINGIHDVQKICQGIQLISDKVYAEACQRGTKSGTTMVLLAVQDGFARTFHVGDSRIYAMREGILRQLTQDHSEVQRLVNMGVITQEEAKTHPKRHVISQFLGMVPLEVRLSVAVSDPIPLQEGDWFLLCSDGLTDMISDETIRETLKTSFDAASAAKALVDEALEKGGRDNVTVICLHVKRRVLKSCAKEYWLQLIALVLAGLSALSCILLAVEWILRGAPI